MNKIRIVLMLGFLGGIFLASWDWANSQCIHPETTKTPTETPVRTDIPDRRPSDSSRPVDSGLSDGIPNGKSEPASSDLPKIPSANSSIEKLEKLYLKQGNKKKDTEEDVSNPRPSDSSRPVDSGLSDGAPNKKSEPASSDLLKIPSEKSSIEKPEKQSLTQGDKKKDKEEDVPKQSTTQKAPWYTDLRKRVVDAWDRAVANNTNKSIANKKTKLEKVNAEVTGWDLKLRKQSTDRYMDDAALGEGRDFKKKFVLDPNAQRKAISGQMDDTDGNIAAIKQERDKAKAKQTQLKKEIADLEAQVAKIQSKGRSVTPVSSSPSAGTSPVKPSGGKPPVNPSYGNPSAGPERVPATSGYAPRPRAK